MRDVRPEPCKMYTVDIESKFVYMVAALLASASGAVDAIAFIMFGCFIANQSGNVIQVGMRAADETAGDPMVVAQLVGSFILGCVICGMLIPKRRPKFPVGDDLYTIAFFLQAIFLIFTSYTKNMHVAKYLGCIACGLMNSITTSWSDGPMRTTHATGPSTEVGLNLGRIISLFLFSNFDEQSKAELMANFQRFNMNVVLVFSFAVGGYAGSVLHSQIGGDALLLPALISIGVAVLNLAIPAIQVESESSNQQAYLLVDPERAEVPVSNSGFKFRIDQYKEFGFNSTDAANTVAVFADEGTKVAKRREDNMLSASAAVSAAVLSFAIPACEVEPGSPYRALAEPLLAEVSANSEDMVKSVAEFADGATKVAKEAYANIIEAQTYETSPTSTGPGVKSVAEFADGATKVAKEAYANIIEAQTYETSPTSTGSGVSFFMNTQHETMNKQRRSESGEQEIKVGIDVCAGG